MPSKLKRALGAVKDQTSISLAKIVNTNSSNLDVAILKATTRNPKPVKERYINEVLVAISSNKLYAAVCANAIAKRIGKTKNWIVALKSLNLVLRIFQDGDPFFPQEVLHARNRGAKILNLTTFNDYSHSSPYDYTAFVRSFAFYLDQRLDCFLTGKLQRGFTKANSHRRSRRVNQQPVREMKPPMLLDRISYWQRLLDRVIATKPTGAAKNNRLVQVSLYGVVRESFDLYRDISDALGLLLDSFFYLKHQSCINAFQYCVKATKQFEELSSFYDYCKEIGIGKVSEYPSVQMISEELMETLQEFLKDQASFPSYNPPRWLPPLSADDFQEFPHSSKCMLFEDLIYQPPDCDEAMSPSFSPGHYSESEFAEEQCHGQEDMYDVHETGSNHSLPIDHHETSVAIDLVSFDDWLTDDNKSQELQMADSSTGEKDCWELALVDTPSQNVANGHSLLDDWLGEDRKELEHHQRYSAPSSSNDGYKEGWAVVLAEATPQPAQPSQHLTYGIEPSMAIDLFDQSPIVCQQTHNPFIEDETDISASVATTATNATIGFLDEFSMAPPTFFVQEGANEIVRPTFQAATLPTLSKDPYGTTAAFEDNVYDSFATWPTTTANDNASFNGTDQQNLILQRELWLQSQNEIMERMGFLERLCDLFSKMASWVNPDSEPFFEKLLPHILVECSSIPLSVPQLEHSF